MVINKKIYRNSHIKTMRFFSKQVSPDKWGIYSEDGLLATVCCQKTCDTIIANLKTGRRDVPKSELNELYRVPKLQKQSRISLAASNPRQEPSVSRRKPRQLKVARKETRPIETPTSRHTISSSSTDSTVEPSIKSPDLSSLQKQQVKIAQTTRTARKVATARKAERA